jgi:hypothetical protein
MNAAICTLFEGHYHFGVASLSNSLYNNGFRGTVYVGYRGKLPEWALKGEKKRISKWKEATILNLLEGFQLVFLPLTTHYSLTNYKPDFLLELWEGPAKNATALFYFDPDIIINDSWTSFEQWVHCGVALSEDINSPLQEFHPRRVGWRAYFKDFDIHLKFLNQIYVNGGFIGLLKDHISFLNLWVNVQESMGASIGGLKNSIFSTDKVESTIFNLQTYKIFSKSDQDALNATIEAYKGTISFFGKEGMGFASGHISMYHALGENKPWNTNHLLHALKGKSPRSLDSFYCNNIKHPILAHSMFEIFKIKITIKIAKFIGRIYSNNR